MHILVRFNFSSREITLVRQIELLLFEPMIPGELLGKEVIDSDARRVGIVRGIKLKYPPLKAMLIIRGKSLETNVPIESIDQVGKTVIRLKMRIDLEEISAEDVITLLHELKQEILTEVKMGHEI